SRPAKPPKQRAPRCRPACAHGPRPAWRDRRCCKHSRVRLHRGVAKRSKAPGFDPGIRRFESCRPCHPGTQSVTARAMRTSHMKEDRNILIFSGNANRPLTQAVCRQLGTRQGKALVSKFSDGEVQVEIEENVRRQEVFVLQSTCAPAAEHLVELVVLVDALTRASAASVTAVIPYFGYARQDRRPRSSRVPITAKVAAKIIGAVGTARVL